MPAEMPHLPSTIIWKIVAHSPLKIKGWTLEA